MAIEFFVHPELKKELFSNSGEYKDYERSLNKVLEASELPILITNGLDDSIVKKFSDESILYSKPSSHESIIGEVSEESWSKLADILKGKKDKEMVVHGAFFGECTEGFALQLFVYLTTGKYWDGSQNRVFNNKILKDCEYYGNFSKSNVKYGTVLKNGKNIEIIKPTIAPFRIRNPGNLTHQLIGDKTKIYRLH